MARLSITTLAVAIAWTLLVAPASAQTAAATFDVSITVEADCTITVDDLSFGTVADLTPEIAATTTGTVACTGISPVSVSFDPGTGGASTFATREMALGSDTIDYNLYADAAHTEILGDGTTGTVTIDFTSTGGDDGFDVFGQTAAAQNPKPAGTYTSTITATVTF
ncbi:MAG: spore coat U domain-containing protein [Luteitalea sp.]|nr:spore coat U domain-containing protein [Luteitalea sp.]